MNNYITKALNTLRYFAVGLLCMLLYSCNKNDILNAKPATNLVVPKTIPDFQAMLDVQSTMNVTPAFGDASGDNYYATYSFLQTSTVQVQAMYEWGSDIWQGLTNVPDWNGTYTVILTSNLVLEGLNNYQIINSNQQQSFNNIKGQALFFRSFAFFNAASLFSGVYDSATVSPTLGIPLRLTSDITATSTRATLKETYDQIIGDLNQAASLLPLSVNLNNKNRPSKPAAFALMARVYLTMRNYTKAGLYADSSLQLYNSLNDLNTVRMPTSTAFNYTPYTFLNNSEILFNSWQSTNSATSGTILNYLTFGSDQVSVDSNLYRSYNINDLRRSIYYFPFSNGAVGLNGSYAGNYNPFSGLATNEMYLIRAECYARSGNVAAAINDLNTLISKRWKATAIYTPYSAITSNDALNQILTERRKELPFSSVRWTDLKRLNKEGYNIILTRIVNGQTFTLAPNDPKYILPIPPDVIQISGIQQNHR